MRGDGAVEDIEHLWIPMPDGTRLAARLWLPRSARDAPVPAILEYIPYRRRDLTRTRDERHHPAFAAAGYACLKVDMRGSGDSEGVMPDMYAAAELDDALEVIAWLADQPWCNGRVGMMGQSWGGTASLQAAARRPPALRAVLASCATDNRFEDDIHHMGGCLLTDSVEWGATLPAILASPPDSQTVGPGWRDMWMARLEASAFPLEAWIRHESRDAYWRHSAVVEQPGAIACPVLAIGGWADRYSNTVMNLLASGHPLCWGIVGPWGHHYASTGEPGPTIGFVAEALRWWDRWLREVDNGVDRAPRLRVWRLEHREPADRLETRPGRWIAEAAWPSARIAPRVLCLSGDRLQEKAGAAVDWRRVPDAPRAGLVAGDTGYFGRPGGLPLDQRAADDDGLVFETAPLEEPLDLLGHVVLTLPVRADRPVATLTVRLNDVPPEGGVARIAWAVRNLALDDEGVACPLEPGAARAVRIVLPNAAWRLRAGHRLRLALSGAYWPQVWRTPEPVALEVEASAARLELPLRPDDPTADDAVAFAPPAPVDDAGTRTLEDPPLLRESGEDDEGRLCVRWRSGPSLVRFPATGLVFGAGTEAEHVCRPDSLEDDRTRYRQVLRFEREGWLVEVDSTAELRADRTHFRVRGRLVVRENGIVVFERDWAPVLPRTCS